MKVHLDYGRHGLDIEVPDQATVVKPVYPAPIDDEAAAVRHALAHPVSGPPLAELVKPKSRVAVVFPDITRPMPNRTVLPPLLEALADLGCGPAEVELLCATGTHRRATDDELEELIGAGLHGAYRVHQHDAADGRHVEVGQVDGTPILLDPRYVDADVRICTGFVEPHFFAGFSGGPKGVCPGLAATETILEAHAPARIAHRSATWAVTRGNPVHDFVRAAAALAPPSLSLDVTIDAACRLTAVVAGPLPEGHDQACRLVEKHSMAKVDGPFDVVVSTNGGYPLDRNLYQAVKGMAAAERVVVPGGTIIMAAQCVDGVPAGGPFASLLARAGDAAALAGTTGLSEIDRWQTQVLGRVLAKAQVRLFSGGLSDADIGAAHLQSIDDVSAAVARALDQAGPDARVCVLPHGPLTVATVTIQ